jgi:hypothetical protein
MELTGFGNDACATLPVMVELVGAGVPLHPLEATADNAPVAASTNESRFMEVSWVTSG